MKQFNCIWYDDSVNAYIFLYLNYLSKMKVPEAMLLDQVMNKSENDPEVIAMEMLYQGIESRWMPIELLCYVKHYLMNRPCYNNLF